MREPLEEEDQQPAVDRKAGDGRRRWDLLHSSGPHAQEPNETAGKTAGRLQVESSLPGASNETTCFLEAAGERKKKQVCSSPAPVHSPWLCRPTFLFQCSDGLWATAAVPHAGISQASCFFLLPPLSACFPPPLPFLLTLLFSPPPLALSPHLHPSSLPCLGPLA